MKEQADAEFLGEFFGEEIFLIREKETARADNEMKAPKPVPSSAAAELIAEEEEKQPQVISEETPGDQLTPDVKPKAASADADSGIVLPLVLKGQPESDTLVILHVSEGSKLKPEERKFLSDILKAVQLDLKETAWMDTGENPGAAWPSVRNGSPARHIIAFGADESLLPAGAPLHEIFTEGNKTILRASLLSAYLPDHKPLKRDLWRALQQMFK